ncbi:MAG: hypothetical protein ACRELT_06660 [Longimicrobiales bacterium]
MFRRLAATAMVMSAVLPGAGVGQQSITASATILERIDAGAVEVEVRSVGSRLSVRQPDASVVRGTRLLRSTFVHTGAGAEAVEVPVRVREGGILRLERRRMRNDGGAEEELRSGSRLLIDMVEELTITRVVAANS